MKKLLSYSILATSLCTLSCVVIDPNAPGGYAQPTPSVKPATSPAAKPAPSLTIHLAPAFEDGVQQMQLEINGQTHLLQNVSFARPIPTLEFPMYAVPRTAKKALMYKDVGAHEEDASKIYIEASNGKVTLYSTDIFPGEMGTRDWKLYRTFSY